jgi:glycine/D-amino acid oxidase-like deaminating enzyme
MTRPGAGLTRREMLRRSVVAGSVLLTGCVVSRQPRGASSRLVPSRRLAPVFAAPDRVIRAVAGLRPFRPSGFVVRAESLGDHTLVHNYGHGGGGISLGWGSSMLAVELAAATGQSRFAVLGCGVMGLTTARLLQDRGFEATIYARDLPPDTTSNIAGGLWSPVSVADADRTTPAYRAQFERAARAAHRYYQRLDPTYGVRWIEQYTLRNDPFPVQENPIADLYLASTLLSADEHPFAARYVRRYTTMLIEPATFLTAITRDFLLRDGKIQVREFRDRTEVAALPEPVIVNCTGLGSGTLFGDAEMLPIKGQLAILLPQPEVDYIMIQGDYYMFPRSDGIVLGGTRDRGDWSLTVEAPTTTRIVENHRAVFAGMKSRY